ACIAGILSIGAVYANMAPVPRVGNVHFVIQRDPQAKQAVIVVPKNLIKSVAPGNSLPKSAANQGAASSEILYLAGVAALSLCSLAFFKRGRSIAVMIAFLAAGAYLQAQEGVTIPELLPPAPQQVVPPSKNDSVRILIEESGTAVRLILAGDDKESPASK